MVDKANIAKNSTRRASRQAAREAAIEKAHTDEQVLASSVQQVKQEAAEKAAQPAPQPKLTKQQKRQQEREAAERRADAQERNMPEPHMPEREARRFINSGNRVPLHLLNQLGREAAEQHSNFARDVANVAGRAAFEAASGRGRRGPDAHTRANRMRDAQAAMEKKRQEKAAGAEK